ncbi:unnamed protein product, partial [Discosporangium mesarthrocarpum]
MLCANISTEVPLLERPLKSLSSDGAVDWRTDQGAINLEGQICNYGRSMSSVTMDTMQELIGIRMKIGKKAPQGWALTLLANSLYSTFGAKTSPMYMRESAVPVTTIGRWMISLTSTLVESVIRAKVLHGDTDIVF